MGIFRSLKVALVFFVFMIMICSSILSGIILILLNQYNIFAQVESARILFLITGLITSTIIGTILTYPLGKYLLKPLEELIEATREVSKGDFSIKVKEVKKNNIFSELIRSFNTMTKELSGIEMFRKDFINNFSHEFKTPIVSIAGFARLLRRGSLSEQQRQEYLAVIEEESMRLADMATNVLNLTKIENQTILSDVSEYNLSEQIRSCILLLENKWAKKDLDFSISLQEHNIYANEELLKQVWINLLDNAIKFTPPGGMIEVALLETEQCYRVSVRNNGSTIPPEQQGKIFNKFYQGDESHASEGNGVGLAIVKRVVELHNGDVSVSSQNDVTIFTVELPKTV